MSAGKKILYSVYLLLLCYVAMEALSFGLYYVLHRERFHYAAISARIAEASGAGDFAAATNPEDDPAGYVNAHTLHPYTGFIYRPDNLVHIPFVNRDGLLVEEDPYVASRDPQAAIVAIAGGSIAERVFKQSLQVLRGYLEPLPMFKDKRIVFIQFGESSYRQPQPFFSMAYYLLQGGRLDMLITLDGRNEATSTYLNWRRGIYPAFPLNWEAFFRGFDPDQVFNLGDVVLWNRARWKGARVVSYMRYSITASTVWELLDRYFERRLYDAKERSALARKGKQRPYFISGPNTFARAKPDDIARFAADLWEQSSLQTSYLAKTNGFMYFHFLQPSQYVPGSKELTQAEKAIANFKGDDARVIPAVYALYRKRIPGMQQRGVDVMDLTDVFATHHETLYTDVCCHMNQEGNDLLADAMGRSIAAHVRSRQADSGK